MKSYTAIGSPLALFIITLPMLLGCGGGSDRWTEGRPPVYPVSGRVMMDGEPVSKATVTFQPESPEGKAGSAVTDEGGYFEAQTFDSGDGLTEGTHRVAIQKTLMVDASGNVVEEVREPGSVTEKNFIPERYADFETSGIEITVDPDGANELEPFDLTE